MWKPNSPACACSQARVFAVPDEVREAAPMTPGVPSPPGVLAASVALTVAACSGATPADDAAHHAVPGAASDAHRGSSAADPTDDRPEGDRTA